MRSGGLAACDNEGMARAHDQLERYPGAGQSVFERRAGPTMAQRAIVKEVAKRLRNLSMSRGSVWIDPRDGRVTPAAIDAGQIRRRLIDCACFSVRA
jgi:hypothetical protein